MNILPAIKYGVNSTLGTSDFKPLDKMYKDSLVLVATTNPITGSLVLRTNNRYKGSVTIGDYGGVVNVHIRIVPRSTASACSGLFGISKNNTLYVSQRIGTASTDNQYALIDEYIPVSVNPGDVITVTSSNYQNSAGNDVSTNNNGTWCLCGNLGHDGKLATVTEE